MQLAEVLQELEACGTEQNRKVYRRHGVGEAMFGVSYADLGKLAKRIRIDQELARGLWATGVHDAQVLATMVGDPAALTAKEVDTWVQHLDNYVITDAFSKLISRSPHAVRKLDAWCRSPQEWIGACGWNLVALLASDTKVSDDLFDDKLATIAAQIHDRKNRVRHAMNQALITIGLRGGRLEKKALAVARQVGQVEVDHGETGCRTPDAAEYIRKTKERRAGQGASSQAKSPSKASAPRATKSPSRRKSKA